MIKIIPITVLTSDRGTVSYVIKGKFGRGNPSKFSGIFRPIITWNLTYGCNLKCIHCYTNAGVKRRGELSREDCLDLIDQIASIKAPLLIFSGGEPLLRNDFYELAEYAASKNLRLVLSTNGTLISEDVAKRLAQLQFIYIGVSIDSPYPEWHDMFRGVRGAFNDALKGLKNCSKYGLNTGIRYIVTSYNVDDVPDIINLALRMNIRRITFYHLSSSGRAIKLSIDWYMKPNQYFKFMDYLIESSRRYAHQLEIETTMAPFDGIYVADKISRSHEEFWELIEVVKAQGGCGRKIISIYPDGNVYPCQFVDFIMLGNVKERNLREILDIRNPGFKYFVEIHKYLKGPKCSKCPFKEVCGGGDRIRAYYLGGGLYGDDPLCYLDTKEIYEKWKVN